MIFSTNIEQIYFFDKNGNYLDKNRKKILFGQNLKQKWVSGQKSKNLTLWKEIEKFNFFDVNRKKKNFFDKVSKKYVFWGKIIKN